MPNKLSTLFGRAKEIYQQEGLVTLLNRAFTFLISWLSYENCTFYIYEQVCEQKNEADFLPKIQNVTCKVVETTQQLDGLLKDGFDLSLLDVTQACQRLGKRAVAILLFVELELAWKGWAAMTEEAKNTFNRYPYKVDFANKEACGGDVWTNPKYRRQGLLIYGRYKRREYLMEKGVKKLFVLVLSTNTASVSSQSEQEGRSLYAKAHYLRVGRMQFWKETPIKSIKNNN